MVLFIVSLALFMEALDTTVINTAIPTMAQSLNVNPIDLKIALISYLLSLAIFIPISGWMADKFGTKRIFISAIFIFILSSFWCGFAHNLCELIIARTLQGFGGAFALPVGRLIILSTFPRHDIVSVMSRVAIVAALGTMLGPLVGGFITHYFSWRWIFWINIPVGLLAMVFAWYWIIGEPPKKVNPLDKIGFILFGGSLAGFTFGLSAFSESTFSESFALFITSGSVFLLLCYIRQSRRKKYPVVKTKLLRIRTFRVSVIGNLFSRLGFGGVPFLVPLLLQIGLHYPAQISGMFMAPVALGIMLVKPFALSLLRLFGYKKLLISNTLLLGLSIGMFYFVNKQTSFAVICGLTCLFGFLVSLQYSAMNSLAYTEIEKDDLSAATSIMSTLQQLTRSFGVAISAFFLRYFSTRQPELSLTVAVFHSTFLVMGVLTFFSAFIFMGLKRNDGSRMIEVHL
ncbi:MAG: Multidrug efflux protein [Gammaproteobacteria bacterium]|nr:Multidrug efflux protein [Gammaproteobacteria bacterium]